MKNNLIVYVLVVMGFIFATAVKAEEPLWQARINKEGITVDTRKVEGSPILEFKSEMIVAVPIDKAIALFEDASKMTQWYYQCVRMELLEEENDLSKIFYFVINLPWPVAERDSVFRRIKSVDAATGAITYELSALPEYLPKEKGKIRVPYLKTTWRFTPLKDGGTEVYFQQHSNAGGSIPAFIANALVLDIPFHSLKRFRKLVE